VAEGEIEVCNAGGCLAVAAGQSYYVPDANTKPIFSNKQTYLPPPQPIGDAALVEGVAGAASGTVGGLVGAADGLLDATTSAALTTLNATAAGLSNTAGMTSGLIVTPVGAAGGIVTTVTTTPGTLTKGITAITPLSGIPTLLGF